MKNLQEFFNGNYFPSVLGFVAAVFGALMSQFFNRMNMVRQEQIKIASLLAEERYQIFKKLCCLIQELNGIEQPEIIHLEISFDNVKIPKIYHEIFNSRAELEEFRISLFKIVGESGHLFTPKLYIYFLVFQKYLEVIYVTIGGYHLSEDTFWLLGMLCYRDLDKLMRSIHRECFKFINKPKMKIIERQNFIYSIKKEVIFHRLYKNFDLIRLSDRIMKLDASKQANLPDLFDGFDDLRSQFQTITESKVTK